MKYTRAQVIEKITDLGIPVTKGTVNKEDIRKVVAAIKAQRATASESKETKADHFGKPYCDVIKEKLESFADCISGCKELTKALKDHAKKEDNFKDPAAKAAEVCDMLNAAMQQYKNLLSVCKKAKI